MNIDQFEHKMILALEGDLPKSEYDTLMAEIELSEELQQIWVSYQELYSDLETVPYEQPSERVKDNFYTWLDNQTDDQGKTVDISMAQNKTRILSIKRGASVAAILVCVFGFWKAYEHNAKVENTLADMSKQMETLMDQQSSTDRIKTIRVNYNPNEGDLDDKMIQVLINVINVDQSSHVRLTAVEVLTKYMDKENVREALIKRLMEEDDATVKLSIISSLGQQQDENSKLTLENIVNDDSQEKFVIDEAHMQLIRYEKVEI